MLVSAAMMACILHTAPCTPAQLDAVSTAVEHCHATQAPDQGDCIQSWVARLEGRSALVLRGR
jgi:hypothetical protein